MNYEIKKITSEHNLAMAKIVRENLKNHGLDIPGTAYFDESLDNLCDFYKDNPKRGYYVLTDENDTVFGGVGFAEFEGFENCAEVQKLYIADSVKGNGFGGKLMEFIEDKMREAGYKLSYLETHSNLEIAIYLYEKTGYAKIEKPREVAHGAMDSFYIKKL